VDDMVTQAVEPISIPDQWALELQNVDVQIPNDFGTFFDLSFLGGAN